MERYRIVADVGLYYVTFTVIEWLPIFIDESACKDINVAGLQKLFSTHSCRHPKQSQNDFREDYSDE
jgi:hypothetical protein